MRRSGAAGSPKSGIRERCTQEMEEPQFLLYALKRIATIRQSRTVIAVNKHSYNKDSRDILIQMKMMLS